MANCKCSLDPDFAAYAAWHAAEWKRRGGGA